MDTAVLSQFRNSVRETLAQYGFAGLADGPLEKTTGWVNRLDATGASMEISGDRSGLVACLIPHSGLDAFTEVLYEEPVDHADTAFLLEIFSEFLNVLVGVVKNQLLGQAVSIDFSNPRSLGAGSASLKLPQGVPAYIFTFRHAGGEILLVVALDDNQPR